MRRRDASVWLATSVGAPTGSRAGETQPVSWQDAPLRGFTTDNMHNLTLAALNALAATGARLARVGLNFPRSDNSGYRAPTELAQQIEQMLTYAQQLGVGLVIVGDFKADDDQAFWRGARSRRDFVQCWSWFAQRFGNAPALRGIDLMNEPHPSLPNGLPAAQRAWGRLATEAIDAIRAAGCLAPIVFEPVAGGNVLGLTGMKPLADSNVVYSIHFYTPHEITHQGVADRWKRRIPYPAGAEWRLGAWNRELGVGAIDAKRLQAELKPASDFAQRHQVPMYVGEFGCVRWAPDGSAVRWVRDCLAIFERERWSWTFHSFRTWPGWDAEIDSEAVDARERSRDAPLMRLLKTAMAA